MSILAAGYAELASAFPSAGGQYHIVYMTFPASTRRFAAFFTGWMSILYTMVATASCSFFVAQSNLELGSALERDICYTELACLSCPYVFMYYRLPGCIAIPCNYWKYRCFSVLAVNYRLHSIACNSSSRARGQAARQVRFHRIYKCFWLDRRMGCYDRSRELSLGVLRYRRAESSI